MYQLQLERQRVKNEKEKSKKYDAICKGLEVLSDENPQYAKSLEAAIAELAQTGYGFLEENSKDLYLEEDDLEL